jgi:hypothetical protein
VAALCVLYGAARLALGAVRLDPSFVFGLQIEQLLALGAIVFGVWYGLRPYVKLRRAVVAPAADQSRATEDSLAA